MTLSRLALSVAQSPTMRLNEQARQLKEKGEPVINLTVGEPTNRTPDTAAAAAAEVLKKGMVKYTPASGLPSLRKAIAQYTEANYGRAVSPANVIVASGAKNALYNLFCTLLDPGDEVIVFAPYWVSYPEMIKMVGAVPVVVTPAGEGFCPTLAEVEAAVSPRTKAVLVNSPNNPSGQIYLASFIAALVEYCERREIYLIMDDIYHKLVFDGQQTVSAYACTPRDIETTKVVVVNGVSKLYGMTGFRIGWVVASRDIIGAMGNLQSQSISCLSSLLQAAAEGALTGSQAVVGDLVHTIEANRDLVVRELQTVPGLKVSRPEGAFYCFPDFSHYNPDSTALCQFLLEKALVLTVPGKDFGMEGHLRLSFAGDIEEVAEGLARIRWALDPGAPRTIQIGRRLAERDW